MPEHIISTQEIRDYLSQIQGREITLADLRKEFNILQGTKSFDTIRNILFQLSEAKIVRPTGKRDGTYKVILQVSPVKVFVKDREKRPPFELIFPRDFDNGMEIGSDGDSRPFNAVLREGDVISLGGVKSTGKTTLCLNFCGENISKNPVLMGNEYTQLVPDKEDASKTIYIPAPRFFNRLESMDGIEWADTDGNDKFTLLPVREDYAEHVIKDRINIIDWINIDADRLYDISKVLENIKANLGRGIAIVALQKGEGAINPRGGQFVRDFSDLEILLDGLGESPNDILLTVKGVKEVAEGCKSHVGKTYAYAITHNGVRIQNFREVKRCPTCHGNGFIKQERCETCYGNKFIDKEQEL